MATKYVYSIRRLNELTEPSKARGLLATVTILYRRLKKAASAPDRLEYDGEVHRPWKSHFAACRRVRAQMRRVGGPDRIIVRTEVGADFAIRKYVKKESHPVPDGPGTDQIDKIKAAVMGFCADRGWRVTDMGTCVDKPGEHGFCNAWDGGCISDGNGELLPADEIHRRNIAVASFIREEGVKFQNGNGGLPVNGTIVMTQYWEHGMGPNSWNHYSGVPHVTHWHVSGFPSRTGWV